MKDRFGHEVTVGDTVAYVTSDIDWGRAAYPANRRRINVARVIGAATFAVQLEEILLDGEKGDPDFFHVRTTGDFILVWGPEGAGV